MCIKSSPVVQSLAYGVYGRDKGADEDRIRAFNRRLHAGKQSIHFTGTLDHHTLHPGNYVLYVRAIDTATGYRSPRVSAKFTVLGG